MGRFRATYWLGEALVAQVEELSVKQGVSRSEIVKQSLIEFLKGNQCLDTLGQEVSDRAVLKRRRVMLKDQPIDDHDGMMLVPQVWQSVNKELAELRKIGILEAGDYDYAVSVVRENIEVAKTHERGEQIVRKLELLIKKLEEEKQKLVEGAESG